MQENEMDAQYAAEYKKMLKEYARMAARSPDMIPMLRVALKSSAAAILSNRQEVVADFQKVALEVDAFLSAFQSGEVDPQKFLDGLENECSQFNPIF